MKNLLVRIIFGFTIGVTLLVLSYLGIYYIAGQETFNSVILKLTDVTILQHQLLLTGFTGSMMGFAIFVLEKAVEKDDKSPTSLVAPCITFILALVISIVLVNNLAVFDEVTAYMFSIIGAVLFCTYTLFHGIQEAIDELILNKKIKEKNG